MIKTFTYLSVLAAFAMTACSTTQEPSQYRQMNSAQNSSVSMSAYQDCLRSETNRELLGGALGGTAGAIAGEKLLGGTEGVVAGAALGGMVGYGIGGKTMNCGSTPTSYSNTTYQSSPTYGVTPAAFRSASCPAGTTSQPNGTCLMKEPFASGQASASLAVQTPTYQQYETAPRSTNLVKANALIAPSTQSMPQVTRHYGASPYQVASGDTVYSLARRLCVSVGDIQGSNGLDNNYGIQIGQTLQLPSNQC